VLKSYSGWLCRGLKPQSVIDENSISDAFLFKVNVMLNMSVLAKWNCCSEHFLVRSCL